MDILGPYRTKIDSLDDEIVDLLIQRESIIQEVAAVKSAHGLPAIIPERVDQVRERCANRAAAAGLEADFIRVLYTTIIEHSCDLENTLMAEKIK